MSARCDCPACTTDAPDVLKVRHYRRGGIVAGVVYLCRDDDDCGECDGSAIQDHFQVCGMVRRGESWDPLFTVGHYHDGEFDEAMKEATNAVRDDMAR